tara:strand:- start:190 stop:534 length:345 start_codon:yes stop_codon:yes gene_type:complete
MFIFLEVEDEVKLGNIVAYNTNTQKWGLSDGSEDIVGVVNTVPEMSENKKIAKIIFSGSTYAIAGSQIPDEGCLIGILNGKVCVGNTNNIGIVSPAIINSTSRQSGDLVMIHIK